MGIATKAIVDKYGPIKDIKVRFAGHVFPGETLEVSSWREGSKIVFCQSTPLFKVRTAHRATLAARCLERKTTILSNAAATLA
jgi:multifunctional beta-oxidation protein